MGKFYLLVIVAIAIILGIITVLSQNKNSSSNPDQALQNPTIKPTNTNNLQLPPQNQNQTLPTQQSQPSPGLPQSQWVTNASSAAIKTAKGEIDVQLYAQDAPKTVTNFATLSKIGYYNNLTFHRVEDWVIQGGDPNGNGSGGTSIYGPTFEDELNQNTQSYKAGYKTGVLAMANRGPNTNGSQFFILKKDYPLDHAYTIFGQVTSGMDIVNQIQIGDKILSIVIQ